MLELYIKNNEDVWQKVDSDKELTIATTYEQQKWSKPEATINDYSKTVNIPGTANNNKIFNSLYRLDYTNSVGKMNPNQRISYRILNNGEFYSEGYLSVDKISKKNGVINYAVTLYGGIGAFFYNLMYDEEGNDLTLADLYYGFNTFNPWQYNETSGERTMNEGIWRNPEEWNQYTMSKVQENVLPIIVNYDKNFVLDCWNLWKKANYNSYYYDWFENQNDMIDGTNNIYYNFAPILAYKGYHEDFDNDKILFNQDLWNASRNLIIPYTIDNYTYSAYYTNGWSLIDTKRDLDTTEIKDIRSNYLPLGIKLKCIYDAIKKSELNQEFSIDDSNVNNQEKELINQLYMVAPPFDWKDITLNRFKPENKNYNRQAKLENGGKDYMNTVYGSPTPVEYVIDTLTGLKAYTKDAADAEMSISFSANMEYFISQIDPYPSGVDKVYNFKNSLASCINRINASVPEPLVSGTRTWWNGTFLRIQSFKDDGSKDKDIIYIIGKNIVGFSTTPDLHAISTQIITRVNLDFPGVEVNTDYMFIHGEYKYIDSVTAENTFPRGSYSITTPDGYLAIQQPIYTPNNMSLQIGIDKTIDTIKISSYPYNTKISINSQTSVQYFYNVGATWVSSSKDRDYIPDLKTVSYMNFGSRSEYTFMANFYVNHLVHIETWEIFYGDSAFETHELTKKNILGNTMSPYDFLKSLGNLFNWKFELDHNIVKIYSADRYFKNEIVDISDKIDYTDIQIKPTNIEYNIYEYNINTMEDEYPRYMYNKKFGSEVGLYRYNTSYNLNTDKHDITEGNNFNVTNMWKLGSPYYYKFTTEQAQAGSYYNRAFINSTFSVQYWNQGNTESKTLDFTGLYAREPDIVSSAEDDFPKLAYFDKDNKQLDFKNSLCFRYGIHDQRTNIQSQSNQGAVNVYYLSDTIDEMFIFNNKPCHMSCPDADSESNADEYGNQRTYPKKDKASYYVQYIPLFTNYTNNIGLTYNILSYDKYLPNGISSFYDNFYKTYNECLLNGDNKILTVKYKLIEHPLNAMKKIYMLENKYYILNKINDYQPGQKDKFVKCEFVSISNHESLTHNNE